MAVAVAPMTNDVAVCDIHDTSRIAVIMEHTPSTYSIIDEKNFVGHEDEVNCMAFSPDFEILVTGSDDEVVRVFNVVTGNMVIQLKGHTGPIRAVAVCPSSKCFASASFDTTICLWETRTGSCKYPRLEGHTKSVECLAFSFDSKTLCSGSWDKCAILWDVATGNCLRVLEGHTNLVQSVSFSWKDNWLATGSWDYTVCLWKLSYPDNQPVREDDAPAEEKAEREHAKPVVLRGHAGNVHSVAFSKEGMLASGSWDKTIRLWNPRNAACLHVLVGHNSWIQAVAFSADSLTLATAGEDDTVRMWDCVSGALRGVLQGQTESVYNCAFGSGSAILVSGAANATLTLV